MRAMVSAALDILEGDADPLVRIRHAVAVLGALLDLEDVEPDETPEERARRKAAERARKHRRKGGKRDVSVTGTVTRTVTESVTERDGGSVPDLNSQELQSSRETENLREKEETGSVDQGRASGTYRHGDRHADRNGATVTRTVTERDGQSLELVPDAAPKAKRGTRAPSSVDPAAGEFCRVWKLPPPTPGSECANFLDYWTARTGKDATSTDWAAKWRSRPEWTKRPAHANGSSGKNWVQPVAEGGRSWKVGQ